MSPATPAGRSPGSVGSLLFPPGVLAVRSRLFREPVQAEGADDVRRLASQDVPGYRVGGHRGQKDAVPMVAGREHEAVDAGRSQDRSVVARTGAESYPEFVDRQFLDAR